MGKPLLSRKVIFLIISRIFFLLAWGGIGECYTVKQLQSHRREKVHIVRANPSKHLILCYFSIYIFCYYIQKLSGLTMQRKTFDCLRWLWASAFPWSLGFGIFTSTGLPIISNINDIAYYFLFISRAENGYHLVLSAEATYPSYSKGYCHQRRGWNILNKRA